jgi:hypothetical protein
MANLLLAAAIAVAAPPPPPVVAPPPILVPGPVQTPDSRPASPAALRLAHRLEELTEPRALMVAGNYAAWEATVRKTMSLNADVARVEQTYPGIIDAGIDAARPLAKAFCEDFVGRVQEYRANAYATSLSERELAQAIAYFETPGAQRIIKRMIANLNPQQLIDQVAHQAKSEGRITITKEQAGQMDIAAAARTSLEVSDADKTALMRFAQTEAGRKYTAARAASETHLLALVNTSNPEHIRRQNEAVQSGMMAFISRKKSP